MRNLLLAGMVMVGAAMSLAGCRKEKSTAGNATLNIEIEHMAAGSTMVLNTDVQTPLGEPVRYTVFKYYLSHVALQKDDGSRETLPVSYHLVDESVSSSKSIAFVIPTGSYKSLIFTMGVDSARNVSGVQEGALDPANGMFWTWNSGYIMAKMEGKSPLSTAPLQNITFHIGGFRQANSVLRTVELPFPSATVHEGKSLAITLSANVDKWWNGKSDIHIGSATVIMEPGDAAMKMADNYATMFTINSVQTH